MYRIIDGYNNCSQVTWWCFSHKKLNLPNCPTWRSLILVHIGGNRISDTLKTLKSAKLIPTFLLKKVSTLGLQRSGKGNKSKTGRDCMDYWQQEQKNDGRLHLLQRWNTNISVRESSCAVTHVMNCEKNYSQHIANFGNLHQIRVIKRAVKVQYYHRCRETLAWIRRPLSMTSMSIYTSKNQIDSYFSSIIFKKKLCILKIRFWTTYCF